MKKLYMILAAMTLLSMSLNAQLILNENPLAGKCDTKTPTMITGKDGKTIITAKAPARAVETMTSTLTFTAKCNGSGTADDGVQWTVTSDAAESTYEADRGIHYGTNNNTTGRVSYIELTTSDIPSTATITKIVVYASRASSGTGFVSTTVGGDAFGGNQQTLTASNAPYTFEGNASGPIVVRIFKNASARYALYCKSIVVTYETDGGDTETATLDIFSDTQDANTCLPVYGGYHDHTQHNQMVYPASMLTDMVGKRIKSMTFYPASVTDNDGTYSGIGFRNGSVTFKLMEVTNSTGFNSSNPSFITGSMTTVKTVTMPSSAQTSATTWLISFDQPFEYNGGDLVIDVTNTTGNYRRTYFYTGTTSIAYPGYYTYSGSTGSASVAVDYVPKVTFTYEYDLNKTAKPTITYNETATDMVITATGDGTVTLTVGNQTASGEGSVSITIPRGLDDTTVTATATAQEQDKLESDPATEQITIHGAGRTPMPTINVVWNGDQCTITATGDGEVHMYVDGVEVTQPYVVEQGASAKTIVVTATAEDTDNGMAISNTATETVQIPALNTSGWDQLDGTYSSNQNVDFGKILFVDRFSVSTANDEHPYGYDYVMKETKGQKRKTNTVPVEVQHTGVDVGAYATLDQVNLDVDRQHVALDVLNAEQKLYLSPSSKIFYYTLQRGQAKNTRPTSYMSVMQRQGSGNYMELLGTGGNNVSETEGVPAATFYYRMDDRDVTTGIYGQDFMAYVPVVWTYGYDRVGYNPNDPVHNSYGAPIWRTGAGMVANIHGQVQAQTGSKWTVWNDPNGKKCCLFRAHLDADGLLPSDGSDTINVKYEPYMFRIWVVCDSLRNYSVAESGFMVDGGAYGDTIMWLADVPCRYIEDLHAYDQHLNYGNIDQQESYTNQLVFGANAGSHPTFIIRFYYRAADHTAATAGMRDGGGNGYGAAEGGYDPGNPGTGITEAQYEGTVVSQTYYNAQGMKSDKPFDGLNIVVTRYSDGSTRTTKVMR